MLTQIRRQRHEASPIQSLAREHFNLQAAVLASLPENQDLVHPKTLEQWEYFLRSDNHEILSLRDDAGRLVAHAVAILPDASQPDPDILDMNPPSAPENVTTLSAVMTHPEFEGHNAMYRLIEQWIELALRLDRPHLLAVITTTNFKSWTQFLKGDMAIVDAAFDPSDNSTCFMAHRNLNDATPLREQFANASNRSLNLTLCPRMSAQTAKSLFEQGYIGHTAERGSNGLYTGRLIMTQQR